MNIVIPKSFRAGLAMDIFVGRRSRSALIVGIIALALLAAAPAQAGPWRRDGDIRHFDNARWQGGRWRHDYYGGRLGWWWVVAGTWYFYPQPVYPYPDAYVPPENVTAPATAGPAAAQYWYYCPGAQGYYPYVPSCQGGWQQVPATPSPPGAPPGPQ